ncbi:hypothetical protein CASFOL_025905 [Castilleja foliolosa]|uniref:Transmembrane 9 superfamily member n=1 Tax=Castilleja foliolosa TaxID=1961234 RepID=A0ABD3CVQ9_9LAMI
MGCRASGRVASIVFCLVFLLSSGHSFYLPGVAPRDFIRGDELQVKVNKLSSTKTQLPYDFYFLKYCKPKKIQNVGENLGEVLRGDRIENSVYTFHMRDEQSCKVACKVHRGSNLSRILPRKYFLGKIFGIKERTFPSKKSDKNNKDYLENIIPISSVIIKYINKYYLGIYIKGSHLRSIHSFIRSDINKQNCLCIVN